MSTVQTEHLVSVLDDVAPRLEHALVHGPINPYLHENSRRLGERFIRRGGTCQPSSELLEIYLPPRGVGARLHYRELYVTHRNQQQYLGGHVLLRAARIEGYALDPTWQQFLCFVGLTPQRAQADSGLAALYPEHTVAVVQPGSTEFADVVAEHAHALDVADAVPRDRNEPPVFGLLRDTTLDEKVSLYRDIWDLNTYSPASRRSQLQQELYQSAKLMEQL